MFSLESYEFSEGIAVVRIRIGDKCIDIAATVEVAGNSVTLRGGHVGGEVANRIGVGRILALLRWTKQELGLDELRIEGATRTSEARPGHLPRPFVF
jgi:hypothetical protein